MCICDFFLLFQAESNQLQSIFSRDAKWTAEPNQARAESPSTGHFLLYWKYGAVSSTDLNRPVLLIFFLFA